jgi:uncharacterized Zn finger protein
MSKTAKTWWGRRFIEGLEAYTEPHRLARGKQYLSGQRIIRWDIAGSRVDARIRGRVNPYFGIFEEPVYEAEIEFVPIPDSAWNEVIRHIGGRAGFLCRLLVDEMPDEIEKPLADFGVSLLPAGREDLRTFCSCPDDENPCKHVAGLYYLLASRLDQDPFLLFELRGLPRAELARRLRATPLGSALASALTEREPPLAPAESFFTRPEPVALPEAVSPRDFWRAGKRLPPGVEPPQPAAVPGILIRKGGDYPPFWDKEESFVEAMEAFYEQVRKKAGKEWL